MAGAQGRQEASGSLGAMRTCGARCVRKVGQRDSAKPGRGWPAGRWRRLAGASASHPCPHPAKGKPALLPQPSCLPAVACGLARRWLTRGRGQRLALPTLEETRVTKEVCASNLNACTATPVCSHSHTCLLTQSHLSAHTVTPVCLHSHTCLPAQSHTCLLTQPHLSACTVTHLSAHTPTPVCSHSHPCLPAHHIYL